MRAKTRAFSLIELIVTIGIVATLAAVLSAADGSLRALLAGHLGLATSGSFPVGAAAYLGE